MYIYSSSKDICLLLLNKLSNKIKLLCLKYLDKSGINDLTRENFTFSTKVNVGKFYEQGADEVNLNN